jgi:hypothetical protein
MGLNVDTSFANSIMANAYKIDRAMENVFGDMERAVNVNMAPVTMDSLPSFRREAELALSVRDSRGTGNNFNVTIALNADSLDSVQKVLAVLDGLSSAPQGSGMMRTM